MSHTPVSDGVDHNYVTHLIVSRCNDDQIGTNAIVGSSLIVTLRIHFDGCRNRITEDEHPSKAVSSQLGQGT